jgi:hypothetical protein
MANTAARTIATAQRVSDVAQQVLSAFMVAHELLEFNSDQAIDWAAGSLPAYIPEDAAGNIDGLQFSRQQVANALGSMTQLRNLMTNATVTEGDHLGTLNLVADPA